MRGEKIKRQIVSDRGTILPKAALMTLPSLYLLIVLSIRPTSGVERYPVNHTEQMGVGSHIESAFSKLYRASALLWH